MTWVAAQVAPWLVLALVAGFAVTWLALVATTRSEVADAAVPADPGQRPGRAGRRPRRPRSAGDRRGAAEAPPTPPAPEAVVAPAAGDAASPAAAVAPESPPAAPHSAAPPRRFAVGWDVLSAVRESYETASGGSEGVPIDHLRAEAEFWARAHRLCDPGPGTSPGPLAAVPAAASPAAPAATPAPADRPRLVAVAGEPPGAAGLEPARRPAARRWEPPPVTGRPVRAAEA